MKTKYQVEQPFVAKDNLRLDILLRADGLEGLEFGEKRTVSYIDTYWDTSSVDLHASARTLRTRTRSGVAEFLDYKGPPCYVLNGLFSRPFATESVTSDAEAESAIRCARPSVPIQALYADRPDLLGRSLAKVASCHVERTNFHVFKGGKNLGLTISAHKYIYEFAEKKGERDGLIELQPTGQTPVNSTLAQVMKEVGDVLVNNGWSPSPTSKYHRIPREILE